jgi:dipeptidase E
MKLVLASQGFTTPEIANAVSDLIGKPLGEISVAVINEAYVGIGAGRHEGWLINELSLISHYIKGTISFVNLRAYDIDEVARRLEFADLIYIVGGAQVVLQKIFRETGFDKLVSQLATRKVIMGTSAGANVLGRQIEDPKYWQDQYGEYEKYLAEPTLGLVNFNILPHFEREDHPLRTTEKLTPLLKDHPFLLYGVTDTQAVVLNDKKIQLIGGDIKMFGRDELSS